MFEAKDHPTLLAKSIFDLYKVFEPLFMMWMLVWVNPYNVTPLQVGAKFWKCGGKIELK